jgi:hypothetical protein
MIRETFGLTKPSDHEWKEVPSSVLEELENMEDSRGKEDKDEHCCSC